jgi:histidine ammonia-lyase
MNAVILDGNTLTLSQIDQIISEHLPVRLSDHSIARVRQAREIIEHIIHSGKTVYGVNTGFGKFSDVRITADQIETLQENIVRSHSAGVGRPLPDHIVALIILLKINGLAKGYSGVRHEVIETLIHMFNKKILPVIPEKGSVGASGDLAPLAHLALVMIGEGRAKYHGLEMPGLDALNKAEIPVLSLKSKEGLAILNGTQVMTAIACDNMLKALNLIELADILGALTTEVLFCTDTAFDDRIQKARNQEGQIISAENLRVLLENSPMIQAHRTCANVQDAYSVRWMPQVHGASRDAVQYVKQIVEREINAATDNPLIFTEQGDVLSGGNFHGQPVALAMDFLSIAMSELGSISERRTAWMMDTHINGGLPAFLAKDGGLNSGYMIAQYSAAALASENKMLCHPASVDSIPTSANKEDHVSMGTIGARKCASIIENVETIFAIEWLCACRADDFRKPLGLAPRTQRAFDLLRQVVPTLERDSVTSDHINSALNLIQNKKLVETVWD